MNRNLTENINKTIKQLTESNSIIQINIPNNLENCLKFIIIMREKVYFLTF